MRAPLKVTLRLVVWDVDEETGARSIRDIKEQDVYMGDMPLMTANGTFVVNGTERVIVSQMHRSPGVFFDHDKGKTHSSGKYLHAARVIPYRGSWLDFEFDAKDLVYVRIDRRRKLPATTLLMALDDSATEARRAELATEGLQLAPEDAVGMSAEDILSHFYDATVYSVSGDGWKCTFDAEGMRGQTLNYDLVNDKDGEVIAETGAKVTPRLLRKLGDEKITMVRVTPEEMYGRFIANDIVNEETGEVFAEAGDEITEELLASFAEAGITEISILAIDHFNIGPYIRNTLAIDKNTSREGGADRYLPGHAPGRAADPGNSENLFNSLFFIRAV